MQQLVFEIDTTKEIRTSLLNLHIKHCRTHLQPVLSHIKSIAVNKDNRLCLQLIANEAKDTGTIEVSKEIVEKGTYRKYNTILLERNSSFLLDFLSIGVHAVSAPYTSWREEMDTIFTKDSPIDGICSWFTMGKNKRSNRFSH